MISVEEALEKVNNLIVPTKDSITINVSDATGFVLYNDVVSQIHMPPFRQSAMDGYALSIHDGETYNLVGEIKAGDNFHPELKSGDAVRIFTGAPVPDSANAVMMQEKVEANGTTIKLSAPISLNQNIRPQGEQVKNGAIALPKGTKLTSAAIAFITSLGITTVSVFPKPSVAIIVTGNELATAGQPLQYGQIYESNATMLNSALDSLGFVNITTYKVEDNYDKTVQLLDLVITNHDVVLISGGISVGDYDYVGKALQELNVEQQFYKVKQKPGKPLFFGKKENKIVFALPGNPAAALSCFYVYVQIALERISGNSNFTLTKTKALSKSSYIKKGDRAQFLKAIYKNGKVEILDGQSSAMLQTFALANALAYLPETSQSININDEVNLILLPNT